MRTSINNENGGPWDAWRLYSNGCVRLLVAVIGRMSSGGAERGSAEISYTCNSNRHFLNQAFAVQVDGPDPKIRRRRGQAASRRPRQTKPGCCRQGFYCVAAGSGCGVSRRGTGTSSPHRNAQRQAGEQQQHRGATVVPEACVRVAAYYCDCPILILTFIDACVTA